MLSDQDFLRYSRQLLLEEFGLDAQEKLQAASVLIVGLGGLGAPPNLQRQILYRSSETGQPKAELAKNHLLALNPQIEAIALSQRLDADSLAGLMSSVDLVLDCSDNMPTRHAVNAACIASNTALISGSAVGFGGQLLVLTPPFAHGCYRCLWPDDSEPQRNCRTAGVLGPVVGTVGTLQALEALKMLAGEASPLDGKLRLFDGRQQTWRTLSLTRSSGCPVCGVAA
ncbi:molybdopterin-synthase adenylyltransferase [bacteria symbiont BFo1 of Frankliniella occidentalis]|nr:molybdopterin-synthase adenylyltransferase [bacteria symbiont BFo1 of Frankliniella occidentalis]